MPKHLLAAGCLIILSLAFTSAGALALFFAASIDDGQSADTAEAVDTEEVPAPKGSVPNGRAPEEVTRGSVPAAGEYNCFTNAGSVNQIFVQKFRLDGDSYRDLSFGKGDGKLDYDPADGSMTFSSGPFKDRYLGVFVAKGSTIKKSPRFYYRYAYTPARSDTVHLLDPEVDYSKKIVFGIYCSRSE